MTNDSTAFIGIEETNEAEGETFGYYISDTPANRHALERLGVVLGWGRVISHSVFRVVLEPASARELEALNRASRNNYMPRVQFITESVDWSRILCAVENDPAVFYKGAPLPLIKAARRSMAR